MQVLQEFYVNAEAPRRRARAPRAGAGSTRKIAKPLPHADALERVRAFARWPMHEPSSSDMIAAAAIADDAQLSFWDAMIVRSAAVLHCSVLWSEDLNDGQVIAGVEVRSPFAERPAT